jgi:hypothetical protein
LTLQLITVDLDSHQRMMDRIAELEAAMRSAIESAEANGMGDWKQFAMLRNALKR